MTTWRYTLQLPGFSGEVEADTEDEAREVATIQAEQDLSWNSEWWGLADLEIVERAQGEDE